MMRSTSGAQRLHGKVAGLNSKEETVHLVIGDHSGLIRTKSHLLHHCLALRGTERLRTSYTENSRVTYDLTKL